MAGKVGKCPKCTKPLKVPNAPGANATGATAAKPASPTASAAKPKPSAPKVSAVSAPVSSNPLDQLLSDAGLQKKSGPECPDCGAVRPPHAAICIECGLQFETGHKLQGVDEGPVLVEKFKNPVLNRAQRDIIKDEEEVEKLKFAGAPWWVTLAFILGLLMVIFFGVIIIDGMAPPGGGGDGWLLRRKHRKRQRILLLPASKKVRSAMH